MLTNNELWLKNAENGYFSDLLNLKNVLYDTNAVPEAIWSEFLRTVILQKCKSQGVLKTISSIEPEWGKKSPISNKMAKNLYTPEFMQGIIKIAQEQDLFNKGVLDTSIKSFFFKESTLSL